MAIKPDCDAGSTDIVIIKVKKGESLTHSVTVRGAKATFALKDEHVGAILITDDDDPVHTLPDVVYERNWPLGHDDVKVDTNHTLSMIFIDATSQYVWKVVHHREDGTDNIVSNCTYKGTATDHSFSSFIKVVSVK